MSVLDGIVARKKEDLLLRKRRRPLAELQKGIQPSERDFFAALKAPGLGLIAEIKKMSPSKGMIREDFEPAAIAGIYERHASAISVLCDEPFFGGRHEFLGVARANASRPLLCKDFILEPYQLWEARYFGADAVLLMASILNPAEIEGMLEILRSLDMAALVEVHDEKEAIEVLGTSARIVGVNSRDLKTLAIDEEIVSRLGPSIREHDRLLVAESGLKERGDIEGLKELADAVLIGSTLMGAPDIEEKIKELGF